jgi:hypothetical protein
MSKLNILTGRIARPQKTVIFGPEGIGKSTLAAQFPAPVFLDTEGGTHHLDVARLPAPKTWADVVAAIAALATEAHDFKTLVIDTADWLEKLLVDHVCKAANKASIEDFGYGKGYVVLAEEFAKFLASIDPLLRRGMHVLFLAHTKIVKFEQPDAAGAYDRYELKLSKQVGPLMKEWCDLLLFGNYFTRVAENDSGRKRGVGGRERKLYTTHSAAWDAKNRHGFDEMLNFEFASIASAFNGSTPTQQAQPAQPTAPAPSLTDKLAELFAGKEDDVNGFLLARQQIKPGQTWRDLPPDYAQRVLAKPEDFLRAVGALIANGGAK